MHADGYLTNIGTTTKLSNAKIVAADIGGSGKAFAVLPASGATLGATWGSNLTSQPSDAAILNGSIAMHADGYLTNIGTTTKLSNAKIVAADIGGSGKAFAVLPASGATLGATWGSNIGSRPAELTDGRIATGLTSVGILDTDVPTLKGGTGETNTNKFLNSGISVAQSGTTFTLTKGDGTTDTTTVSKAVLGLSYTDGATANGTTINSSGNITGTITAGANVKIEAGSNRIVITD